MHHSPTLVRRVALLGATALTVTACGGSDDEASSVTTTVTIETTVPESIAAPTTPTVSETTAPGTSAVPATTAPETTVAPETTAPATTAPASATTTAPTPTTEGDDGNLGEADMELVQFCYDSEQVYVFDQVVEVLTDPTPEQAEAALSVLAFTIDAAVDSAPDGMDAEPQAMADIIARIDAGFAAYDYDVIAFAESPDADAIDEEFVEYENLVAELTGFIEARCTTASAVLDSHALKLAPQIDRLRDLPLRPIANQAGDIRLFVPVEWSEWIGTTEVESVTFLEASDDLEGFESTWNAPGVLATVSYLGDGDATTSDLFDSSSAGSDCTLDSTEPYDDPVYVGELYLLSDCAGVGTDAAVLAVTDIETGSVEVTLEFQFPDGAERDLLDQMLATFAAGA